MERGIEMNNDIESRKERDKEIEEVSEIGRNIRIMMDKKEARRRFYRITWFNALHQ